MKRAALFGDGPRVLEVFGKGRRERLASLTALHPEVVTTVNFPAQAPRLADLEVIFSTWGMPRLGPQEWARLPELQALFHAAGTVRAFARPLLDRGVVLVSARHANAVPVAEFALAQIVLAAKGYFRGVPGPGCCGETVALLGAGAVGRALIERLKGLDLSILLYDASLPKEEAARLGVEGVSFEAAFERGFVVSNHLPDLPETKGALGRDLFRRMRPGATFLNTGRGATVVEAELAKVMAERPDLTALLDVTWPEPPDADSPLRGLPNVRLSPHLAGSIGDEVLRLADASIEAFRSWELGEVPQGLVTPETWPRLA